MKNFVVFVVLLTLAFSGFCQSYVFCPELETDEKQGLIDCNISIILRDSRVYDKKLKEKCAKSEIFTEFVNGLKHTYPKAKITTLGENRFDEDPSEDCITIKIDLQKYDATFYGGMYISNTKFEVRIFDNRNGNSIISEVVTGEAKQWNAVGYTSGKIASKTSFKEAFDKFTALIDKLAL